jgi:hypothetical protein
LWLVPTALLSVGVWSILRYVGLGSPENNGFANDITFTSRQGSFAINSTVPLLSGMSAIIVEQTTAQGITSDPSGTTTIRVPDAPVVSWTTPISTTGGTSLTIPGTGTPGSTVTLFTNGTQAVGTAIVGLDGTFVIDVSALPGGNNVLTLVEAAVNNATSPPVAVGVVDVPQTPMVKVFWLTGTGHEAEVEGTGKPNCHLEIFSNGTLVGSGTVEANGSFSTRVGPLPAGVNAFVVRIVDPTTGFVSQPFRVPSPPGGFVVPTYLNTFVSYDKDVENFY